MMTDGASEHHRAPPTMLILQLCCVAAIEGMDMGLLPAVNLALQQDLGLRLTDLSWMTLAQAVAQALLAPLWGVLADRKVLRRKTLLSLGALIQGLCTVLLAFTKGFSLMLLLRILNGAALASLKPLCVGLVADTTAETLRGRQYGYLELCVKLGMMAAALIGTPMSRQQILGLHGWQVAFLLIGSFSLFTAFLIQVFMREARREKSWSSGGRAGCAGAKEEMQKLGGYFRKPTFLCLVGQGLFGAIPWNAFGYSTMYFQVNGLSDAAAAGLSTLAHLSNATGHLLGGFIGDAMAKRCPLHGRPFTANFSVSCGIPCAIFIFLSTHQSFTYYAIFLVILGLGATWCAVGVNWPILSEIVEPQSRSGIMAWESAMEGAVAACLGNALVGLLAQVVFGFNLAKEGKAQNAEALGKALALTSVLPWTLCLFFYILLHWAFPYDRRILQKEKEDFLKLTPEKDNLSSSTSSESESS
ncbi:Quinolone resistance protein NorA [Durusdinium trenchii]|uniref:Quinolone resistance protein NorA n=1 Tax=Durusdinium trenchii TaxID=1381693 RepID=A0ABP0HJU5_9DINO